MAVKYHGNMDDEKWKKHRKYGDDGSKKSTELCC